MGRGHTGVSPKDKGPAQPRRQSPCEKRLPAVRLHACLVSSKRDRAGLVLRSWVGRGVDEVTRQTAAGWTSGDVAPTTVQAVAALTTAAQDSNASVSGEFRAMAATWMWWDEAVAARARPRQRTTFGRR
jgi:hypothetical protein